MLNHLLSRTPRFLALAAGLLFSGAALAQPTVSTVAGSGTQGLVNGPALSAQLNSPRGQALDAQGNLYIADTNNNVIRRVDAQTGQTTTFAGNGTFGYVDGGAAAAQFRGPRTVLVKPDGTLLVADTGNNAIRQVDANGIVTTVAGGVAGYLDGPGLVARFAGPVGMALDNIGNVYVTDINNFLVRKIQTDAIGNATVSTFAGSGVRGHLDGPAGTARFLDPQAIAADASSNLYVADRAGHRIRLITPAGQVSTLAGTGTAGYQDGPVATALLSSPVGVIVAANGTVYVADRDNYRLRAISSTGQVSTLAGTGIDGFADGPATTAQLGICYQLNLDATGRLYAADLSNHRIRRLAGLPLAVASFRLKALETFSVWPNPAVDAAQLRYELSTAATVSISLLDALGRPVREIQLPLRQPAGAYETPLAINGLPAGLYLVCLRVNGTPRVCRLWRE